MQQSSHLKSVVTSKFDKKDDLANWKSEIDKLDID